MSRPVMSDSTLKRADSFDLSKHLGGATGRAGTMGNKQKGSVQRSRSQQGRMLKTPTPSPRASPVSHRHPSPKSVDSPASPQSPESTPASRKGNKQVVFKGDIGSPGNGKEKSIGDEEGKEDGDKLEVLVKKRAHLARRSLGHQRSRSEHRFTDMSAIAESMTDLLVLDKAAIGADEDEVSDDIGSLAVTTGIGRTSRKLKSLRKRATVTLGRMKSVQTEQLKEILQKPPPERSVQDLVVLTEKAKTLKFFSDLSQTARMELCRVMTCAHYTTDSVIYRSGQEGTHFYIVMSGKVTIHEDKEGGDKGDDHASHETLSFSVEKKSPTPRRQRSGTVAVGKERGSLAQSMFQQRHPGSSPPFGASAPRHSRTNSRSSVTGGETPMNRRLRRAPTVGGGMNRRRSVLPQRPGSDFGGDHDPEPSSSPHMHGPPGGRASPSPSGSRVLSRRMSRASVSSQRSGGADSPLGGSRAGSRRDSLQHHVSRRDSVVSTDSTDSHSARDRTESGAIDLELLSQKLSTAMDMVSGSSAHDVMSKRSKQPSLSIAEKSLLSASTPTGKPRRRTRAMTAMPGTGPSSPFTPSPLARADSRLIKPAAPGTGPGPMPSLSTTFNRQDTLDTMPPPGGLVPDKVSAVAALRSTIQIPQLSTADMELGPGGAFGQQALMQETQHTETAVARGDTVVLILSKEDYNRTLKAIHLEEKQKRDKFLLGIAPFSDLYANHPIIQGLSRVMKPTVVPKNATIVKQNQAVDSIFFIVKGCCTVTMQCRTEYDNRHARTPHRTIAKQVFALSTLVPGEYFGEHGFINDAHGVQPVTVITQSEVEYFELSKEDFFRIVRMRFIRKLFYDYGLKKLDHWQERFNRFKQLKDSGSLPVRSQSGFTPHGLDAGADTDDSRFRAPTPSEAVYGRATVPSVTPRISKVMGGQDIDNLTLSTFRAASSEPRPPRPPRRPKTAGPSLSDRHQSFSKPGVTLDYGNTAYEKVQDMRDKLVDNCRKRNQGLKDFADLSHTKRGPRNTASAFGGNYTVRLGDRPPRRPKSPPKAKPGEVPRFLRIYKRKADKFDLFDPFDATKFDTASFGVQDSTDSRGKRKRNHRHRSNRHR